MEQISIGATMPSLNSGLLSSIEIKLPDIDTQRRIADILSAYDDLIESNRRQIKLLEEAAQRLYEQYLVYNGDIVVGMDGEFHINTWSGKTSYLVQRTLRIRPRNIAMKGLLLQAIYSPIKFFEKTVVGATVAHLGKKHIDTIEILTASDDLYIPFANMLKERQHLLNQNIVLSEARDRLLPKLMSGELEV